MTNVIINLVKDHIMLSMSFSKKEVENKILSISEPLRKHIFNLDSRKIVTMNRR